MKTSPQKIDRQKAMNHVTLIGSVVNIILAAIKIIFGWLGQSQALIADGIHSLSDLATDILVLFAAHYSNKEADDDHPYGHRKIETLTTVALGIFLILVAFGIMIDAILRLTTTTELLIPSWIALSAALASIIAKELLYHYTLKIANQINSNLLKANAWHHRSDAISSVIVVIGIIGVMLGMPILDALAAIGVSFMIIAMGWNLCWNSLKELIDTAIDSKTLNKIKSTITSVDGVIALHHLRSRFMGNEGFVDVHVIVDPYLSVSEGHKIGDTVHSILMNEVASVTDVIVHIDPEDDDTYSPCIQLPQRHELIQQLYEQWQPHIPVDEINKITLHYLDGGIMVEAFIAYSFIQQHKDSVFLINQMVQTGKTVAHISDIKIHLLTDQLIAQ